jgi:hypothetical protein
MDAYQEPSGVQRRDGRFVVVYGGNETGASFALDHWVTRRLLERDGSDAAAPVKLETGTLGTAVFRAGASVAANPADGSVLVGWTKMRVDGHMGGYPKLSAISRYALLDGTNALPGTIQELVPEQMSVAGAVWHPTRQRFTLAFGGPGEQAQFLDVAPNGAAITNVDVSLAGFSPALWAGTSGAAGVSLLTRDQGPAGIVRFFAKTLP